MANGITIAVPEIEDFEQKIIHEVARQLLWTTSAGDGEREGGYTYESQLGQRIKKAMIERIEEQAREACPIVAAEILEQGVNRVDRYGDRTGQMVSLKTLVAEEIQKSMTGFSGSRKDELGKLAVATIHEEVTSQMKEALAAVTRPVLEELQRSAAAAFVDALQKALPNLTVPVLSEPAAAPPADDGELDF